MDSQAQLAGSTELVALTLSLQLQADPSLCLLGYVWDGSGWALPLMVLGLTCPMPSVYLRAALPEGAEPESVHGPALCHPLWPPPF